MKFWKKAPVAAVFLCVILFSAFSFAAVNFPPPEFETPYKMPLTHYPDARAVWLGFFDVFILLAALALSAWLSIKKRSRNWIMALSIFTLIYFGFFKRGCICAIGSVQDVVLAVANPGYSIPFPVIMFFILPLAFALFFGRVFCGGACPQGAVQDLLLIKAVRVPKWLDKTLSLIPYMYLGLAVLFGATQSLFLICRYDPFVPIFRVAGPYYMIITGVVFLALSTFIGRPYCRYFCPYSVLLKIMSVFTRKKVTVTPDRCILCKLCENACPYEAIRFPAKDEGVKKTGAMTAVMIALVLFGGVAGYFFGGYLVRFDKKAALAMEISQYAEEKPVELSLDGQEYIKKNFDNILLFEQANAIKKKFRFAGVFFGLWAGLILGLKLLNSAKKKKFEIYEPDADLCVACGRCFEYCPIERERIKENERTGNEQKPV